MDHITEQMAAQHARTEANLRPHHNPVVQVAAFAAGFYMADLDAKEKQAYKAAGRKRPLGARLFSFVMNVLGIIIGGPILLAIAALVVYAVGGALYFSVLIILDLLSHI